MGGRGYKRNSRKTNTGEQVGFMASGVKKKNGGSIDELNTAKKHRNRHKKKFNKD